MRKVWARTILLLMCTWPGWSQVTDIIRINGSGSGLSLMKPMAEAYQHSNRNIQIEVGKPLGSSGAVKALLAGVLDIAISSKPLTAEEAAKGAKLWVFGKTPLALVAEQDVPATDLTSRQLEDIFAGRMTQWNRGLALRLVLRPEGDADTQILRGFSPAMNQAVSMAQARPGMLKAVTDPEATALISRTPGGLGVSGLANLLGDGFPLKTLTLNGISPTTGTLASGAYPMAKDIHVVITAKTSTAALDFIKFIYSKPGRALAQKMGVWVTATNTPSR